MLSRCAASTAACTSSNHGPDCVSTAVRSSCDSAASASRRPSAFLSFTMSTTLSAESFATYCGTRRVRQRAGCRCRIIWTESGEGEVYGLMGISTGSFFAAPPDPHHASSNSGIAQGSPASRGAANTHGKCRNVCSVAGLHRDAAMLAERVGYSRISSTSV